jgi:cytochrome b561
MNNKINNTSTGYGSLSVALHWLMFLLIVATFAMMELKGIYPRGSHGREIMAAWHFMLGMTVFALVWLRLVARSLGTDPEVNPPMPASQLLVSKFVHWSLYALMICLPILGWLTVSAKGGEIPFWGTHLPAIIGKDKDLSSLFKNIHQSIATLGYFLIGLHAVAALFHHYFKGDNTLILMVPKLRRRSGF